MSEKARITAVWGKVPPVVAACVRVCKELISKGEWCVCGFSPQKPPFWSGTGIHQLSPGPIYIEKVKALTWAGSSAWGNSGVRESERKVVVEGWPQVQ